MYANSKFVSVHAPAKLRFRKAVSSSERGMQATDGPLWEREREIDELTISFTQGIESVLKLPQLKFIDSKASLQEHGLLV